jgi:hypothetical protein
MAANRNYAGVARNVTNTTSTTNPMWGLTGSATSRLSVYDIIQGSDAVPADNDAEFAIRRSSSNGTTTTNFTPNALDPANPAAAGVFTTAWSVQPTITAASDLINIAQNMRATFRWVAAPNGELIIPATAGAGLQMMAVASNSTGTWGWTVYWTE